MIRPPYLKIGIYMLEGVSTALHSIIINQNVRNQIWWDAMLIRKGCYLPLVSLTIKKMG